MKILIQFIFRPTLKILIFRQNIVITVDDLHHKIKWKRKKITRYANKLVRDKIVLQPKYFPTPFKDLINWDGMK